MFIFRTQAFHFFSISIQLQYNITGLLQIHLHVYVQLKIYWNIFDCAKVQLLQVYFKNTLNILQLN